MSKRELKAETIVDPDFITVLKAREAMSDPCSWAKGCFATLNEKMMPVACWGGHIIKQAGWGHEENRWPDEPGGNDWATVIDRIARKLGFSDTGGMYNFNDDHTHQEVLDEFDMRIASWPNGYKG